MILHDYKDMKVELIQQPENPSVLVGLALAMTMKMHPDTSFQPVDGPKCEFLIDAEHMSVFEHAVFTFLVEGISRSLLAQITRQRTASITSGSQHYQDYRDYPCAVDIDHGYEYEQALEMKNSLSTSAYVYGQLLDAGYAKEEARQVLPNASTVGILWTIDARNLFYFLKQRLCNRNVLEMKIFATKLLIIMHAAFPQMFMWAGPQCFQDECKQGKMQCKELVWHRLF